MITFYNKAGVEVGHAATIGDAIYATPSARSVCEAFVKRGGTAEGFVRKYKNFTEEDWYSKQTDLEPRTFHETRNYEYQLMLETFCEQYGLEVEYIDSWPKKRSQEWTDLVTVFNHRWSLLA